MTDEQQPTQAQSSHHIPENEQPLESETPTGSEPPPTGTSRRMVLLWAGLGVSGVAALGAGAFAMYASQSDKQDDTPQGDPSRRMPGGDRSGMPRGNRPSGAPSGRFPSGGFPSGGTRPARPSGMPSGMPTDQPT